MGTTRIAGEEQTDSEEKERWDFGLFINGTEELYNKAVNEGNYYFTIEMEFIHPASGYKLYYTGPMRQSEGQYWICKDGGKEIILESHFRYGPMIKWHGEYLAEINASSANINGAFFYDGRRNIVSEHYSFYLYVDVDHNTVITAHDGQLSMYNIFTNECIKEFEFDKILIEKVFLEEIGEEGYFYRHPLLGEILGGDIKIEKENKDGLKITYIISYRQTIDGRETCRTLEGEFRHKY
jgi:hypothetical protein